MNAPFRPSNFFNLDNRMTVVLFAGMGGGCDGLEEAGFHVHLAINHDPIAVAVHQKRHPHTKHLRCDVFEVCPREATKGRGVRVLHASPDCTHFSVAKGGKPVSKRRRSLAWVVCRWAGTVRPETITLENVKEIQTWGPLIAKRCEKTGRVMKLDKTVAAKGERVPIEQQWLIPDPRHKGRIWKAWLKHMHGLGYSYDGRVLNCADFGIHTIRTRYFGVAQADGSPIVWPERTHAPRKMAKKLGLKPWLGVHEVIDWLLPVKSIFGRAKELADATKRRTARGVMRYVINAARPFIVPITHSGHDRVHSVDEPLRTITTAHRSELSVAVPHFGVMRNSRNPLYGAEEPAHAFTAGGANHALVSATMQAYYGGENGIRRRGDIEEPLQTFVTEPRHAVVAATMIQSGYGERTGQSPRVLDIEEPAATQVASGSKAAVIAAFMAQHNDGPKAGDNVRSVEDPASTITTSGSQQGVVAAHMLALRGTNKDGRDARDPAATITAGGNHAGLVLGFLQAYYSGNGGYEQTLDDPLGALTQKARHGLVTVKVKGAEYVLTDIGMRMLEPEEGAAAHGFKKGSLPDTITLDGKEVRLTKTQKYHLVGNSVPPKMIRLLAEHNVRREFAEAAE